MRVIIAVDSALLRELLAHVLTCHGQHVVAQAATAGDLFAAVAATPCDVVVADTGISPTDSLQVCRQIRQTQPRIGIVLLSQGDEADYATRVIDAVPDRVAFLLMEGVTGARELVDAVERVAAGDVVVDSSLVTSLLTRRRAGNPLDQLTAREAHVLALMAEGLGNTAIARTMAVSLSTVEKHATAVFRKFAYESTDPGENARVRAVLTYLRHRGQYTPTPSAA
jgi:DNA-binding NarL/FixJ family response regulator